MYKHPLNSFVMKTFHVICIFAFFHTASLAQSEKTVFKTFEETAIGWHITYPDNLSILTNEEIAVIEGRGLEAIGEDVPFIHKNLIWLKKDQFNSFTSNTQPYDPELDGPYEENQKLLQEMILETYRNNGVEFDSETGTYEIDGLTFQTMKTKIYTPDRGKVILTQVMFERLFAGNRTLTLNINYNNPLDQKLLMSIIDSSKLSIRN